MLTRNSRFLLWKICFFICKLLSQTASYICYKGYLLSAAVSIANIPQIRAPNTKAIKQINIAVLVP